MNDKPLIALLISVIKTGLTVQVTEGYAMSAIKQSYQPTQQGVPTLPTIFIHKIADKRYGFPTRTDVFNLDTNKMVHTQIENMMTTFQIDALAIQNPADLTGYTASDLVNMAAMTLQDDSTITTLINQGVGIMRIKDIVEIEFVDERGRYENAPHFDFIVTHQRTMQTIIGSTNKLVQKIYNVATIPVNGTLGSFELDENKVS